MKISDLEPQKKRKDRLNLYIDGSFKAGISTGTAATLRLFIGREISGEEMSQLSDEESYQLCLDKAFLLLSIRMQTEHELWQKLGKKSLPKDIGRTIARLKELGYINDFKFASLWVDSRSTSRGPQLLRTELIKKGVKREIIDQALAVIDKQKQLDSALQVLGSKDKPNLPREERFKKVGGLLARKGFSYAIIKKALDINKDH